MNKSIKRNSESKKAIRRKSPVPARQKKDSFSVKNTTNETSLTNENFERENSLAIESKTNGICDEISASTLTIRLTHSESFTFDNLDQYKKSIVRKDYLEVPYADEEENFHDAIAYFDQEQQYDLPSDPVSRNRWLDRLKSYNDRVRSDKIDPFNFFEVDHEPCHSLSVKVIRGRNISRGIIKDMLDTPDPYVVVHIRASPDGKKQTNHIDNNANPEWSEELRYLLPSKPDGQTKCIAEISLMDSNITVDETYGTVEFDVENLPLNKRVRKCFLFNETSEVEIEFLKEVEVGQDLRPSLALCQQEKEYRSARKKLVKQALIDLMAKRNEGGGGPRVLRETPTIAVIGSGGGFRAMTGYAGAMKALHDTGILDCVTYVGGLSGSSWYLATLYANEEFPKRGTEATKKEIRKNIESSPFWLLTPECLMRYSKRLRTKMKQGQPVTFTDFFGMLIGQTLLGPNKMQATKLTDFRGKIKDGKAPMPLMTCLHVRPKTSALTFQDWVEFTPYEIGMAKYATFMDTAYFGSKFFMGKLAKKYDECPLHFLMGVWGSAFSILFHRLQKEKDDSSKDDDIREEIKNELTEMSRNNANAVDHESDSEMEDESDDDNDDNYKDAKEEVASRTPQQSSGILGSIWNYGFGKADSVDEVHEEIPQPKKNKGSFLNSLVSNVFGADIMESREYRAGKILNYMRGLSLSKTYPLSPFTPLFAKETIAEANEFKDIHKPIEVRKKKVHLVDAGLTFNSPYPPMLRPQRAVDLIISFDFSRRPSDNAEPFKEILLAEKWAKLHHLAFPKIDRSVFEKEGIKECYVFKDDNNEKAPIIIHFVLCNVKFQEYSSPGVKRKFGDKRGNFKIFDDPKSPYSTFNFQYSNDAFNRLHDLVEFNTLLHIETIVNEIQTCVQLRRRSHARGSITLNEIRNSRHLSEKNRHMLESSLLGKNEENRYFAIDN